MSSELATSYAALILTDDNIEITSDKLQTLLKAAGVEVETIWTSLFAKALEGKDVAGMLSNVGSGGGAAPAAAAGGAAAGGAAAEEKKEEKKEEAKEESDDDMGFGKCCVPDLRYDLALLDRVSVFTSLLTITPCTTLLPLFSLGLFD
ncbi:MAG: 60s acidic ribosomal protein-domain-containing protein [Benniella sp.]|nr:MAG: 60s acidic ribosomal protein-domain-containing protein [Benniella sp.]